MRLPYAGCRVPLRLASRLGAVGLGALVLSACAANHDVTGSIRSAFTAKSGGDPDTVLTEEGRRYAANPNDKAAALAYARSLHALDRNQQSVAVLETAAIRYPMDREVLSAYGKALADVGRLREAAEVLPKAHTPDAPDWTVLSAQGSVADQLGDHQEAQRFYQASLKIAPDSPNTLSNLGLSYALDHQLPLAETTLRRAVAARGATMRVRQNLALVLALEGKFPEAEQVARTDLPPDDAAASVASIRAMIESSPTWRAVRKPGPVAVRMAPPPG
jgi:Flp pilus assembly protein TadD